MSCPQCNIEMEVLEVVITSNKKEGEEFKEYTRTLYLCTVDDIWISSEIPK
jgi:chromosomal replication initiation ATPase DnaA